MHKVDCDSEKVQKNFANFSLCDRVVSKASHTIEVNGIFHHHIKAFIACLLNIHIIKLRKITDINSNRYVCFAIYRKSSIRSRPCIILDPKFPRIVLEVL